jgi:predicted mannosyl-3-phosphoglycerate phosphatase (HAD superfamily)
MIISEHRMEEIIFRQVLENFRERSTGEDEQTTVGGFADAEREVEVKLSGFDESNSHAALMQRRENVHVVDVRVSEAFSVVNQQDPVLPRLVVVPIAVLDEKVEDCSIDEIEDPRG